MLSMLSMCVVTAPPPVQVAGNGDMVTAKFAETQVQQGLY